MVKIKETSFLFTTKMDFFERHCKLVAATTQRNNNGWIERMRVCEAARLEAQPRKNVARV